MWAILAAVGVLLILFFAEYLSRKKGVHGELTRKLMRTMLATFVAFWPFFLSWGQIQLLSICMLLGIGLSLRFNLFQSAHSVSRGPSGAVLFAVAIGILAFITTQPWIFTVAMLHVGLADGLATIVGVLGGDHNEYKVFGVTRSLAGSLTFFFVSVAIMVCYAAFSSGEYSSITVLWLPVAATVAEAVAIRGSDNIVVPLLIALVLTSSL